MGRAGDARGLEPSEAAGTPWFVGGLWRRGGQAAREMVEALSLGGLWGLTSLKRNVNFLRASGGL